MKRIVYLSILLTFHAAAIKAARILAVFPTPSISHQVVFRPLIQELTRRGHDVTVITPNPAYPPGQAPKNLTEIDVHDLSYRIWQDEMKNEGKAKRDPLIQVRSFFRVLAKVVKAQLETSEVQDIIKKGSGQFDLIIQQACVRSTLIYAHFLKAPVIHINSFGAVTFNNKAVGSPTHPFLYPSLLRQRLYNLTNWEKIQEFYNYWREEEVLWQGEQENYEALQTVFGPDIPTIDELSDYVQLLLINMNPIWVDNQPVPTNVVYIGGIHITPPKELPKDLQSFLDSSKNGVVFFSLGSNVKPSSLPPALIQMFIKVFSQLTYDVLWKWDTDLLPGQTENIKISKWLPQSDLLRHPNIKLFITQGGLQSTDEAIYAGVPLIGIPFRIDQWYNAEKYVKHKIGAKLDLETLNEEEFRRAIYEVTGDKSYRENIVRLRALMSDQPQSPLQRAVWWTEHVLRHGGAHLRAAGANISWADYLELELVLYVLSILTFTFTTLTLSIYVLLKFIICKVKIYAKEKID